MFKKLLLIVVLGGLGATVSAQTIPTGFQEYHVVGYEEHIWNMFVTVANTEGFACTFSPAEMVSVVAVTASTSNQIVYYDHWEDGFEADILNPIQATTLVLGDNNPANGNADLFTNDPRISSDQLLRGTNLKFNSDQIAGPADHLVVPIPRNPADIRYDGGDRLFTSGGPVTLVHFQRPNNCNFIGSSIEILSRQAVGNAFSYSVPVGTNTFTRYGGNNTPGEPFKYVFLDLAAFADNTQVFVDNNSGGTASFTLNKGQHYNSQGAINGLVAPAVVILEGTKINTSKPIAGMVYTAGSGTYQDRPFALLPDLMHSTDFMITAPGDDPTINGSQPLNLYIYNPNQTSSINVTATDSLGSNTFSIPANSVRAYSEAAAMNRAVPANSTARLTSNSNFWGFSAYQYDGLVADWGHSWLATRFLSNYYSVSWSPGTSDPIGAYASRGSRGCNGVNPCDSENRSPLFISALQDNTRIQIDLNNDGVYDSVDTNSDDVANIPNDPVTNTYIINALQSLRVYDHRDYDNTGTQIISDKNVVVAYGQDTEQGVNSDNSLDLGNGVYPLDQRWLDPVLSIEKLALPNFVPLAGGNVNYVLTVKSYSFAPLSGVAVYDFLPAGVTYVNGSTVITYPGGSQSFLNPTVNGNRLDWVLSPNVLNANETLTIQYTVNIPLSATTRVLKNQSHVDATLGIASIFSAMSTADVVQTDVTFSKSVAQATASVGQTLNYTINVTNGATVAETNVIITDPIPDYTTFTGPITSANGFFTGVYVPAQNAVVWSAASFPAGATDSLTFAVTVNTDVPGGTVIQNRANYGSAQTSNFNSNVASTTILGPVLVSSKTGPSVASPGDVLTFSITVRNTGGAPALNLLIVDNFPGNSTYFNESMDYRLNNGAYINLTDSTAGDDPGYEFANRLEFRLNSLAAGSTVTFRFRVTVNGTITPPNFVNNSASVSSSELTPEDTNLVQVSILVPGNITPTPGVNSPIFAGATFVSGTSPSPNGTIIRVFTNGVFAGQTVVSGGTWTLSGLPVLATGNQITADATESGKSTSNLSPPVFVSSVNNQSPMPVVNSPIYEGDTFIAGTSISPDGTLIDVYVNGAFVGQTSVLNGAWVINNIGPLALGQIVRATATETGKGTSSLSAPVTVTALPSFLKRSSANGAPVVPGQALTYTIKVHNNSAQTWDGIVVNDPLPIGTSFVAGSTQITSPGPITQSYRDNLDNVAYNGTNGSLNWSTQPFTEINDGGGSPSSGEVVVTTDLLANRIRIRNSSRGINRLANLSGYTSATLNFLYRRDSMEATDYVDLEVSGNGGASWTLLNRYQGPATDVAYLTGSFAVTNFIAANTMIRWVSSPGFSSGDRFWIDDVEIQLQGRGILTNPGCAPPLLVGILGCDGYTLLSGETMTINFTVTLNNPLLITQIDNTAFFTTIQTPVPVFASVTDYVSGIPDLLRNDQINSLSSYDLSTIFVNVYPVNPALDKLGVDLFPQEGEGILLFQNGSEDDDDNYKRAVPNIYLDPDNQVLNDANRPLVFYELSCSGCILSLSKENGKVRLTY